MSSNHLPNFFLFFSRALKNMGMILRDDTSNLLAIDFLSHTHSSLRLPITDYVMLYRLFLVWYFSLNQIYSFDFRTLQIIHDIIAIGKGRGSLISSPTQLFNVCKRKTGDNVNHFSQNLILLCWKAGWGLGVRLGKGRVHNPYLVPSTMHQFVPIL